MHKRVYIITGVNSNGWLNQSKAMTIVDMDKDDLLERAYNYYEGVFVSHQSLMEKGTEILTKEDFINTLEVGLDVKIKTVSNEIEFSLFEKNIWIDDDDED